MNSCICVPIEHIESEIALKPEPKPRPRVLRFRAYRIGDRAQAGTGRADGRNGLRSISNRRSRSSRNMAIAKSTGCAEHIESEIALKPELYIIHRILPARAYRIGDRAQAGTTML